MSKAKRISGHAMLDLGRPPANAGDPVGCLATTFTFSPGLFDEQCLARFMEIDSEPNREALAFLLERETRLGGVYAGVLVDHTQAGVEHSLRRDVLPVRLPAGRQHAKLSLLAWTRHVRIIVASANLTDPGYRTNHEVAASVEFWPEEADSDLLADALEFLRNLIALVPGAQERPPEIGRAQAFLDRVQRLVRAWEPVRRGAVVRRHLVFTLPAMPGQTARSSLDDAVDACRARGGSPHEAWVASPFFDVHDDAGGVTAAMCKLMARGRQRKLRFCVPAFRDENTATLPRLAAPKALLLTPPRHQGSVTVAMLPDRDADGNHRPWHAKMLALHTDEYSALMIGSSNFTCAGMGVGQARNAEANLLVLVKRVKHGRDAGQMEAIWSGMNALDDPESAEWFNRENEDEKEPAAPPLPVGFLAATYRAGDARHIVLRFDPANLPDEWCIYACGQANDELLTSVSWSDRGRSSAEEVLWRPSQPPEKLLLKWAHHEAFMPLNVEDSHKLPPPVQLDGMSADDMLFILAAADPSAAFRLWARRQQASVLLDADMDSATPPDLDPLQRYDLQSTFLHRVRRRARILAQLRANLERPVWGVQALEWRLKGIIGIEPLAKRLLHEFASSNGSADESLLSLVDFFIVLNEVDYKPSDGALRKAEFDKVFRSFLADLVMALRDEVVLHGDRVSADVKCFWERMVQRCSGQAALTEPLQN